MQYGAVIPRDETEKLFSSGRRLSYKKGEIIQRANETPQGVYFLSTGYVKEYSIGKDGSEHFQVLYAPNELFSVIWAYLDVEQNVYREALTDVVIYKISAEKMRHATQSNPVLQHEVTMLMMWQMHTLKARVENYSFTSAYDKVAYRLLYLAGRFGEKRKEGWFITLESRHQQIAEALSITRETTSRMVEKMEREGLIKQDGKGHFIIRDPSALARTIGVEEVMVTWPHLLDQSK